MTFSQYTQGRLTAVQYKACVTVPGLPTAAPAPAITELFTYHPAGAVTAKRVKLDRPFLHPDYYSYAMGSSSMDLTYAFNSAGQVTSVTPPTGSKFNNPDNNNALVDWGANSPAYVTSFDNMARPQSLLVTNVGDVRDANYQIRKQIENGTYDFAGRLTGFGILTSAAWNSDGSYYEYPAWTTQSQTYNDSGQLASMGWTGVGTITYNYSATQNNGQITSVSDAISGETITYQYDSLKRLTSASATPTSGSSPAAWTEAYEYDGFGNSTSKTLNGTATTIAVTAATNRLTNSTYDSNGNMTSGVGGTLGYDEANRMKSFAAVSGGTEYYGYAPDNKRVYRVKPDGTEEFTLYGTRGERLGVYNAVSFGLQMTKTYVYFAGKLVCEGACKAVWNNGQAVFQDRLGTNRASGARFRPYGDEITSTANDRQKFGTYNRDGFSGLDYADQRYYASTLGRFNTADPYQASAGPADPASWNRYSYTRGDPVNRFDRRGLCDNDPENEHNCDEGSPERPGNPEPEQSRPNSGGDSTGDDDIFSRAMREQARRVINGLSANCTKELGRQWNLTQGSNSLLYKADDANPNRVHFRDSRQAAVANATLGQYGWQDESRNTTVSRFFSENSGVYGFVSIFQGSPGNTVVLAPLFFNGLDTATAEAGLLHELLHTYTGLSDTALAGKLGLGDLATREASGAITDYLRHDCRSPIA